MDAEFWWRLDLNSPIADIRRMAAVQMLLDPPPASAAAELADIAAREDDAETREILRQIISGFAGGPAGPAALSDPGPAETKGPWAGWAGSPAQRLEWLGRLSPEKRKELAGDAPERLSRERHPLVASAMIRIFGRAWPERSLDTLVPYVSQDNVPVCLAALETLRQRKPDLLLPALPALLTSGSPRVRGAAVRALAEVDRDEALAHLEALLLDADPSRRLEGLRCCFHARFEDVMQLLLKAMAVETDPRRLTAYGTLFEINPSLEAPFRLYELSERASPQGAEVLKRLVAASCRAVGATLLSPADFQKYRDRLQEWIDRRAAAGLAQDIVARSADGRGIDHELTVMIERARNRPVLWKALQDLATLPMPPAARALFVKAVGGASPASGESPLSARPAEAGSAPATASPAPPGRNAEAVNASSPTAAPPAGEKQGTPADNLELLALLTPDDREKASREIVRILSAMDKTSPALVAAAFRAATRCSVETQAPSARRALNGSDPGVVAAAVEYLGKFAPDDIEPLLGRFLASTEPRVKSAAVRVLQRSDPLQAVSALKTMLRSRQIEHQKLGIASLVHVEFSLVREALAELLETNPPGDLLETGLCLFQTNADPEGVYRLYLLEKRLPVEAAGYVRKTRREMMTFLAGSGRLSHDFGKVESELQERAERESKKRTTTPPAYAFKILQKQIPSSDPPPPPRGDESSRQTVVAAVAVFVVLVFAAVAWNVIPGTGGESLSQTASRSASSIPGGRLQIRQVDGWVREERSSADEFKIEAETGEVFRVPCRDYDPVPSLGKRFKGALILMRKNDDGSWFARRAAAAGLR
ncbi:MAG TPA: HEAT repeat domain-containing protein [Candidatus Ozemobacteraceae bacterium]|nr:HEAT repeat domain-containing protein [Candidatus Ozemobacteraceae bacterium]